MYILSICSINANTYYSGPEFWVVRFKTRFYKSYI